MKSTDVALPVDTQTAVSHKPQARYPQDRWRDRFTSRVKPRRLLTPHPEEHLMPWFRVDHLFAFHPKAVLVGNAALGLWVRAGSWCVGQTNDGLIPHAVARALGTTSQAKRLVASGLWDENDDGYTFHDWEEWQPRPPDPEKRRKYLSPDMRRMVIARDGLVCRLCGSEVVAEDVHIDHIKPVALGGTNELANLQVAHSRCNIAKGASIDGT